MGIHTERRGTDLQSRICDLNLYDMREQWNHSQLNLQLRPLSRRRASKSTVPQAEYEKNLVHPKLPEKVIPM